MSKYGKESKRRERRASKKLFEPILQGDYVAPARDTCIFREYDAFLAEHIPHGTITNRIWSNDKGIADFSLTLYLQIYTAKEGLLDLEVATADICHGHAHIHLKPPSKAEKLIHVMPLHEQADVQEALKQTLRELERLALTIFIGGENEQH